MKARCLLVAPVSRDLAAEFPNRDVVRVPGASTATLQAWDTLNEHYFTALADPGITIYGTLQSIPNAVRRYLVQFQTYDSVLANSSPTLKRWIDCTALDFIKVRNNGVDSTKAVTALIAGDRPREWEPMHRWMGNVHETLGDA